MTVSSVPLKRAALWASYEKNNIDIRVNRSFVEYLCETGGNKWIGSPAVQNNLNLCPCQTCDTRASMLPRPALVLHIRAYANNALWTRLPYKLSERLELVDKFPMVSDTKINKRILISEIAEQLERGI